MERIHQQGDEEFQSVEEIRDVESQSDRPKELEFRRI